MLKSLMVIIVLSLTFVFSSSLAADAPGETRVAKWHDDKKATLLLMFDDSMPSHVKNVVPELTKRGFIATFYVNPGKGEWKALHAAWEHDIPAAGMEYGNHTFTHGGILTMENGEEEIGKANEAIEKAFPNRPNPRLISFGIPGVPKGKWAITKEQLNELLAKHNLVLRPNCLFATIHLKTSADMLKLVDKAIETGSMDCVAFHGVGGEWLSATLPTFMELMDGITARKEKLWITDHISAYKYETERTTAEVKVLDSNAKQLRLKLSSKADPKLLDQPLTLVTHVPEAWKKVRITQGKLNAETGTKNGNAQYDALPSDEPIVIEPVE